MKKIYILTDIDPWGELTNSIVNEIKSLKTNEELVVYVNSRGGDVMNGIAIYNLLKEYSPEIRVIGQAASIASVIAMAAAPGKLKIANEAVMLVHKPWSFWGGNEDDMEKFKEMLKSAKEQIIKCYKTRIKLSDDELDDLLKQDRNMTAKEAIEKGFADGLWEPTDEESKEIENYSNILISKQLQQIQNKKNIFKPKEDKKMGDPQMVSLTEAQIVAQNEQLKAANDKMITEISNISEERNTLKVEINNLSGKVATLETELKASKTQVAELENKAIESEIDNFLLTNSKRVPPAERDSVKAKLLALSAVDGKVGNKTLFELEKEEIEKRPLLDLEAGLGIDSPDTDTKYSWTNNPDKLYDILAKENPNMSAVELEKLWLNKLNGGN